MKILNGNGQFTLVALFGEKKRQYAELWNLLEELQCSIEISLGKDNFNRYEEARVHGTLIGLEGERDGEIIWNRNYYELLGMRRAMNLAGLIDFILADDNALLPVWIKVGGFKDNLTYPFVSRGQSPYLRSFSIQGEVVVAMGWPIQNNTYTSGIDRLRRSFNQFNVLHKYHNSVNAYDNDFFFVLGNIPPGLNQKMVKACEYQMRDIMAHSDVPPIQITKDQLSLVAYPEGDTRLEKAVVISLAKAKTQIDELKNFYINFKG